MSAPKQTVTRSWSDEPVLAWSDKTIPADPPLGGDEVAALSDGTRVRVLWGGGNGPHDYTIKRDHDGTLWAKTKDDAGPQDPMLMPGLNEHLFGPRRWQHKETADE